MTKSYDEDRYPEVFGMRVPNRDNQWVAVTMETLWKAAMYEREILGDEAKNPFCGNALLPYMDRNLMFCLCPSDNDPQIECEVPLHNMRANRTESTPRTEREQRWKLQVAEDAPKRTVEGPMVDQIELALLRWRYGSQEQQDRSANEVSQDIADELFPMVIGTTTEERTYPSLTGPVDKVLGVLHEDWGQHPHKIAEKAELAYDTTIAALLVLRNTGKAVQALDGWWYSAPLTGGVYLNPNEPLIEPTPFEAVNPFVSPVPTVEQQAARNRKTHSVLHALRKGPVPADKLTEIFAGKPGQLQWYREQNDKHQWVSQSFSEPHQWLLTKSGSQKLEEMDGQYGSLDRVEKQNTTDGVRVSDPPPKGGYNP